MSILQAPPDHRKDNPTTFADIADRSAHIGALPDLTLARREHLERIATERQNRAELLRIAWESWRAARRPEFARAWRAYREGRQ